jgi:hypothetical protein
MRKITLIFLAIITALSLQAANASDAINYSDTEEPLIDLLSLTNQKMETSKSNNKFQVTVTASDNLNKLERIFVFIYRENATGAVQVNNVGVTSGLDLANPISVKVVNGRVVSTYQATIDLPKGFAAGNYYVYAFAKDQSGNYPGCVDQKQKYCVYSYNRSLPEARFVVTNDGSGSVIEVSEFSLSDKYSELERKYLAEKNTSSSLISTLGNEKANLEKQITILNGNISIQKNENSALKKRISTICKVKPKPKGC